MGKRGINKNRKRRSYKQNKSKAKKAYSVYDNNKKNKFKSDIGKRVEYNEDKQKSEEKNTYETINVGNDCATYSDSEEETDSLTQLRSTFSENKKLFADGAGLESASDDSEESDMDEENIHAEDIEHGSDQESADSVEEDVNISTIENNLDSVEISSSSDPFVKHMTYDLSESLLYSVQASPIVVDTFSEEWPYIGTFVIQIPKCIEEKTEKKEGTIIEEKIFAPAGKVPKRINSNKDTLEFLYIKSQIANNLARTNTSLANKDKMLPLTSFQSEIFSVINNYQDLYYPKRTFDNGEEIRYVYSLHAINHILKTRMRVIHHNVRLTKKEDVPEEFRDQGLVRPKVLIIAPFKDSAYRIIQFLIDILVTEDKGNVINKKRFLEDFTGNELIMPKKNPKPEDYELTFTGNSSDDFKIGITVTKKSLKLYADFYSSDIIIASPLGLRYTIGAEGEPDRNYDFLASIELLIFDQAEIFLMQNWDHVLHIMKHTHLQPKESHGTDFSRVRTWCLNGWAKYYRQTLIFSSIVLPEINAIFNKYCKNYAGKVKVMKTYENGCIGLVYVQLPHVFQKVIANSIEHSINSRYEHFINKIVPQHRDPLMKQTLIYIANYFDYVKIRNYFKKEDISFVQICEYSKDAKIARARDMFFHGDAQFLLYTERHHFFNRIKIKGIRHLVFYQPPNFPHFYYEICNFMQEANMNKKIGSMSNMTVTILYTKYDVQQLAEIVGMDRAAKMVQSTKNIHMLVTDGD